MRWLKKLHLGKKEQDSDISTEIQEKEDLINSFMNEEERSLSSIRGYDHDTYVRTRKLIDYANVRTMEESEWFMSILERNIMKMGDRKLREALLVSIDEDIDNIENETGTISACGVGCAYCCKQAIYLSKYEEDAIKKYLNGFSYTDRKMIRDKASIGYSCAKENGIFTKIDKNNIDDEKRNNQEYLKLGIECPFLSAEKKCLIYPVRPITCATFRNYGQRTDCDGQIAPHCYSFNETYYNVTVALVKLEELRNHKGLEYYAGRRRLISEIFSGSF